MRIQQDMRPVPGNFTDHIPRCIGMHLRKRAERFGSLLRRWFLCARHTGGRT